jgi:hypothetical protein
MADMASMAERVEVERVEVERVEVERSMADTASVAIITSTASMARILTAVRKTGTGRRIAQA